MRTDYTKPEFLQATDRALAMHGCIYLKSLGKKIKKRMEDHIFKEVIKTSLGPAADSFEVQMMGLWVLTIDAKRYQKDADLKHIRKVIGELLSKDDNGLYTPAGYYAYQAQQFLRNEGMIRRQILPGKFRFNLTKKK